MSVKKFSDGEISVSLDESVRNCTCFIVQSTCPPVNDNLMELLVMADSLRRSGAKKIVAVIPYFGYARQDRKAKERDPITAKLVCDLITASGINEIITVDLHVPQIEGFFNIPVTQIEGQSVLANHMKNVLEDNKDDFLVISPDLGSVKRAKKFSADLGDLPVVIVNKNRKKANECEVADIIGEVKGKKVIILDDMIDTAGTLVKVADFLYSKGAEKIFACATHGVFSGEALKKINESKINTVFILDTIPFENISCKKIKVLSIDETLGEKIREMFFIN